MLVQAGKRYKRRDGSVMKKPLEDDPFPGRVYRFIDPEYRFYITVDGAVFDDQKSEFDLVEEANEAPDAVEYDCDGTKSVKCPWCGHEHKDSLEFFALNEEDRDAECGACNKPFYVRRNVYVTYTTTKSGGIK